MGRVLSPDANTSTAHPRETRNAHFGDYISHCPLCCPSIRIQIEIIGERTQKSRKGVFHLIVNPLQKKKKIYLDYQVKNLKVIKVD